MMNADDGTKERCSGCFVQIESLRRHGGQKYMDRFPSGRGYTMNFDR
jgi:hypothetical protein